MLFPVRIEKKKSFAVETLKFFFFFLILKTLIWTGLNFEKGDNLYTLVLHELETELIFNLRESLMQMNKRIEKTNTENVLNLLWFACTNLKEAVM